MVPRALALAALLAAAAAAAPPPSPHATADLSGGDAWRLTNGAGNVSLAGLSLPKYALEALVEAGLAGDPLWRYNELEYRWVAEQPWTFARDFDVAPALLDHAAVDLVLTGVDTVADVALNGKTVARLENAHREHRLPVKHLLRPGPNSLAITILPAILEAFAANATYPYAAPILTYQSVAPYNFLRKPASDFGWDWGPAFAPSGVYGGARLEGYSTGVLTGAGVEQHHAPGAPVGTAPVVLTVSAYVEAPVAGEAGTLAVGGAWAASAPVTLAAAGLNVVRVNVTVPPPYALWWPVGYGDQPLYNLTVTYTPAGAPATAASSVPRRVGLRTIRLTRTPLGPGAGQGGDSFHFEVNGVPIFAKGSNMIPLHIFASKTTPADLVAMVEDSVAANMNMLRVWGGGLYPQDAFYDACDEKGVLVWQEAMFACAMYPRNPAFLAEVSQEVAYQARRLNWHTSLAVWGGNNEIEAAVWWYNESRANRELYTNDYTALFVDTVRAALRGVGGGVTYVDSSPSKGTFVDDGDFYVKRWGDVGDSKRGDVHFYTTKDNALNVSTFPRAKFVSEFGFQSFPSWVVYNNVTEPGDWSYLAPMTAFRQRHPGDTEDMLHQMATHYQVPPAYAPPGSPPGAQAALFQKFIYLTQVYQAASYDVASSYWRRIKTDPDAQTMGVLYWQMNDIWPGFSWTSIDYGGHWRLLHYAVKRFFSPLLASGSADAWVNAWVTSDVNAELEGALTVEVIDFAAGPKDAPLLTRTVPFKLAPLDSVKLWWSRLDALLADAGGHDKTRVFVRVKAAAVGAGTGAAAAATAEAAVAPEPRYRVGRRLAASLASSFDDAALEAAADEVEAATEDGAAFEALVADPPPALAEPAAAAAALGVTDAGEALLAAAAAARDAAAEAVEDAPAGAAAPQPRAAAAAPAPGPAPAARAAPRTPLVALPTGAHAGRGPVPASLASTADIWLSELKDAAVNPRPAVVATGFAQTSPSSVTFTLSSSGVALYVQLDTTLGGVFDDNGFTLLPWEPRTLTFTSPRGGRVGAAALKDSLTIMSLADTLQFGATLYGGQA